MARRPRSRLIVTSVCAAAMAAFCVPALAISSGNYSSARNHCSPSAEDTYHSSYVEPGCYNTTLQVADATHTYLLIGALQTPVGTKVNTVDICIDLTGTMKCLRVSDKGTYQVLPDRKGTPINPTSGQVHVYFGADDNLDTGEHDGSQSIANGPSDGGAWAVDLTPLQAASWITSVMTGGKSYLLTHPLPVGDAGLGACADGFCFSIQTQRQVAYTAGEKGAPTRDAADYQGHTWDPYDCSGPTDTPKDCGDHPIVWWHDRNQTTYVEPGIQIYEDPDPQSSPIGPYPLPGFYVGTCGIVLGGGIAPAPGTPLTNSAHQIVVKTGC